MLKVIYLVVGAADHVPSCLFGAYNNEGDAKARLVEIKKSEDARADTYFIHEMVIGKATMDYI